MANSSYSMDTGDTRGHRIGNIGLVLLIVISLEGCAYTAISTATTITTGKSIGDHAASQVSGTDCNSIKFAVGSQDYLCEQKRTPDTTYNRNLF